MDHADEAVAPALRALRDENDRLRAAERELASAIEALRANEEKFRLAVEAAGIGIWEWNIDSNRVTWDAKKHDVFGLAQGSFAGTAEAFFQLVHPDDRPGLQAELEATLTSNAPYRNEFRIAGAGGVTRCISNLGHVYRADDGTPVRMLGVVQDITERKAIEKTLRDSEEKFRSFVETTSEWIWEVDAQGRLTYSNPVVQHILGYRPEEMQGRSIIEFIHADDHAFVARVLDDAVTHRRGWTGLSVRGRRLDNTYRHLECHGVPVIDERGELVGFRGSDRDVTDRLEAEESRREAHRMEGIGRLAGGFAHHFNNLLAAIVGNADLAYQTAAGGPHERELRAIRQAAQRGALLTKQLLTFAGRQFVKPRLIDLNAHLTQMRNPLSWMLGDEIVLTMQLAPGLWPVYLDPAQFEIAIVNLVANAQEAMLRGGALTISTANVGATDPSVPHDAEVVPGDYVRIEVTDTGSGMTADVAEKAFEPFFSTKELGPEMVGLGLSTCYGIVAQQGGHIRAQSEPGVGSTFRLFLRRALPTDSGDASASKVVFSSPTTATILVVDDEPAVCRLVAKVLREGGYTVLEARSGNEALAVARSWQGAIDVLLTDVVMPGMKGHELADRLAKERPDVRVVLMSGFSHDSAVRLQSAKRYFLMKPLMPKDLLTTVRNALDNRFPS